MESFDLDINNLEPITLDFDNNNSGSKSMNFGGGAEFLMNTSKKVNTQSSNISLGDLDSFESEMNSLSAASTAPQSAPTPSASGDTRVLSGLSNLFGFGSADKQDDSSAKSNLGQATKDTDSGSSKSWDGFMKFSDIPEGHGNAVPNRMSDRDKLRKKKMMMKRLDEWRAKGHVSSNTMFNNDTPYEEVEDEYETALEDKKKGESKKLYGWWFMTFVNTVEYANAAFNPFDINLDGWGEQVNDDIDSYDEIFGELYEKYKGGKLSPEISLMMRLGFSAAVVNFTNKALSTATPGFNDVIRQSPDLMKMFTNATVNSMAQQSPGFAFANNLVNPEPDHKMGAPPKSVDPRTAPAPQRPGMVYTEQHSSRPDINAGRGVMFSEAGVDLNNKFENPNAYGRPPRSEAPRSEAPRSEAPRSEMSGPRNTNLDSILSGLKTKTVNIQENRDTDSMVSASSLKDLNGDVPRSSNRRRKVSDKNVVSLDI
jgi:hypothetical protein